MANNNQITRRDFLKGIAAGAAGMAALGALEFVGVGKGSGTASVSATSGDIAEAAAAAAAEKGLTYTPGTYEAVAQGIASEVKVTMTFDETMITDCVIDVSGETPDIGGVVGGDMAKAILSSQSCDVDAITGATITCNAIKTAAADCISQASGVELTVTEVEAPPEWLGEAPEIADGDIAETLDTECLVVGVGTGGWPTLMTLAEEGVKTIAIEKHENPTGIREDIGAVGSRLQAETEKTFPEMAIDKMEALQELVRYSGGY